MLKQLQPALLVIAIIAVFFVGITPSFSADDYSHLLKDTGFNNTFEALHVFFEFDGREYRPMVRMSLWFNHLMSDMATPFKITNLLLHILITLLIYRILNKLSFSNTAAIFGAAVFGLHPIHITSMHFILGRTDLVAAVFYFATVALVAEWKEKISIKNYAATFLMFIGALLSKEVSITLPLIMLILFFNRQQNKNLPAFIHCLKVILPFIAVAALYLVVRLLVWNKSGDDITVYTNYSPLHVLTNYAQWFFGLLYPFDLYVAQDWMLANKLLFGLLSGLVIAIVVTSILFAYQKKSLTINNPFHLWFALAWLSITLLPMSGGNAHRWYLYIPSFGLAMLVAFVIDTTSKNNKKTIITCFSILLCVYATETFRLSKIWRQQSEISETILKQIDELQLYKKEKLYIANIPFGYKSAYLFTFNSLEEAIEYRFGKAPVIEEISYANISDSNSFKSAKSGNEIQFTFQPTYYEFPLLTALERRFDKPEVRIVSGITLTVNRLADNKKISAYTLTVPEQLQNEFYYFDRIEIKAFNSP